ncbi:zinc-binding dehydrogenase [Intrasporangium sp.]|uniref:zinc-binding dehydrogenase n=1 Tax=Intrasporangium sp. TaxID=1925024 RepID=UPI00264779D2|nr:zinc-binding dehydrogenase [Intrasporangium sp.]
MLGASGVVGQVAAQAARLHGAGLVVAVSRSAEGVSVAAERGADATVQLRDGEDAADLAARMREVVGGEVDLVVDPLCGIPATSAITVLGEGGRLVNLGSSAGATAEFSSVFVRARSIDLRGYTNNSLTTEQRRTVLGTVLEDAAAGELTVSQDVVDWPNGPAAWGRQARGELTRRAVIRVSDRPGA